MRADAQQASHDLIASHQRIGQHPVELLDPTQTEQGTSSMSPVIQLVRAAIATVTALCLGLAGCCFGTVRKRCKWPNTLSCGSARKGHDDRNTGGYESTIERSG